MPEDINTANKMIDELRGIVREYAPKAAFYDDFIENRDWFKSIHIAEELNISMGGTTSIPLVAVRCAIHLGECPRQDVHLWQCEALDTHRS